MNGKWLILIHQIPPKPAYFRVKIWRRLQSIGAVAVKNSVYVIPANDQTLEDFQWILREIVHGGGEASICEANFIEGLDDRQVEALFQSARNADYAQISDEVESVLNSTLGIAPSEEDRGTLEAAFTRLNRKFTAVRDLDFFKASGHDPAASLLERLRNSISSAKRKADEEEKELAGNALSQMRARTWVTRRGVFIDRIACAWLIGRFIDPHAQFKFVSGKNYGPKPDELRFDMYEGEFTHEGDLCSFEVFVNRFFPSDSALMEIGKIIHDLDLKDRKFNKPETPGIRVLMEGLVLAHKSDKERVSRGCAVFDDLYSYFRQNNLE